jgi:DNA polymerase-3 subunit alpha
MSSIYVPLHCHSDFSVGDALLSIDEYVAWLKENKIPAAALTDHGSMSGAMHFNQKCLANGIKPIMGVEAYAQFRGEFEGEEAGRDHFLLLAKNKSGYNKLLKLLGKAMRENFYYKPVIFYEDILSTDDIICSTACLSGRVQKLVIEGKFKDAEKFIETFKAKFQDDFYLECMENDIEIQRTYNAWVVENHKRLGVKMIWTTDTHYLKPEHNIAHDVLKLNFSKASFSDVTADKKFGLYTSRHLFLKTREQVEQEAIGTGIKKEHIEEMIQNTIEVSEKCESYSLKSKEVYMPKFGEDSYKLLCQKALDSLKAKKLNKVEYVERLKHELKVIKSKKMEDYFLIVADICEFARNNDIMIGIGRGSGAGSLVVWLLGITGVDPIKYNLIFARFLNEQRHDPPDIDLDFDSRYRHKIEAYLKEKYGEQSVGHIVSFGRFGVKGALRDTFRAYYKTKYAFELEECTRNIADDDEEFETSIKNSIDLGGPKIAQFVNVHRSKFDIAKVLVGKNRHYSLHAGGVVISNGNLENYIPVMRIKDQIAAGLQEGADSRLITDAGLMKFDILGLNACAIIRDALENTKGKCTLEMILNDENNKKVLSYFQKGDTFGSFQFEGRRITDYVKRVFPTTFEDLVAINALYRPAVIIAGGLELFIENRKNFDQNTKDPFEQILKDTYGTLCYQEQVMNVFHKIGGLTLEESDEARHTLKLLFKGKQDYTDFNILMAKFKEGCRKTTTYSDAEIEKVMEVVKQFSSYSFNRSHSLCYAMMGYAMMYLKAFYPLEFFSALLTNTENVDSFQDKIKTNMLRSYIVKIHKSTNIKILPPDINLSDADKFTIENGNLRYPLSQVKGVGAAAQMIVERRPYHSLKELLDKVEKRKVNKRVIKALIRSGTVNFVDTFETYKKQYKEEIKTSIYGVYESTNVLFGEEFKKHIKEYMFSLRDIEARGSNGLPIFAFVYKLRPTITKSGKKINFVSLYDGTTILDSCIVDKLDGLKEGMIIKATATKRPTTNPRYENNIFNLSNIEFLSNPEEVEKEVAIA